MVMYERKPNPNQDYFPRTTRQALGYEYDRLRSDLTFRDDRSKKSAIIPIIILISLLLYASTL